MIRLLAWLVHKVDGFQLAKLTLALLALGSLGSGVLGSVEGLPIGPIWTVLVLGLIVGLAISRWFLSPIRAYSLSLLAGVGVSLLTAGRLAGPLAALAVEGIEFLAGTLRIAGSGLPPAAEMSQAFQDLAANAGALFTRSLAWLQGLTTGQVESDALIISLLWSVLLWALASWLGWFLQKGVSPLAGLMPAGLILGYTLYYAFRNPVPLLTFLGSFLMLLVVTHKISLEQRWQLESVDYPADTGIEMTLTGGGLTLLILTVAILAPNLTWPSFASGLRWWSGGSASPDSRLTTALGLARDGQPFNPVESLSGGGLPRRHLLGTGPELREQLVMAVQVQDPSRQTPITPKDSSVPLYWRNFIYRTYDGRGWQADRLVPARYAAGQALFPQPLPSRVLLEQQVTFLEDLGLGVYVAGELITVDQPFEAHWGDFDHVEPATGLEGVPGPQDLFTAVQAAEAYRARSRVIMASVAQLRQAGGDIPEEISALYLELPESLPPRVRSLAEDLTQGRTSVYDRAQAIESYLRRFPYTLDVTPPPQNRDVVDYFLFDLQQGYCDYYATAMVVLARAAGLPARLVVGFAQGQFDLESGRFWVSQADAHSWVEVYLPTYGWVEFEPTAGLPALERPLLASDLPAIDPGAAAGDGFADFPTQGDRGARPLWMRFGLAILLLSVGLPALIYFGLPAVRGWQMHRWEPRQTYATIGQALYQAGHRLSVPIHPGDTLYEYSTKLRARLSEPVHPRWSAAGMADQAGWLLDRYAHCLFDPAFQVAHDHRPAVRVWIALQRRLWLMQLLIWLRRHQTVSRIWR